MCIIDAGDGMVYANIAMFFFFLQQNVTLEAILQVSDHLNLPSCISQRYQQWLLYSYIILC